MTPGLHLGLVCLCLLAFATTLVEPAYARQVDGQLTDAHNRQRRSLLAATQQISQCEWISGEGCALHPAYVSYILNRTHSDVVASFVANSLACASVVDKGACDGISYCSWDPSFISGQQGCFLHESAALALQLQCIQPESRDSLSKLQSCMAARHSCQCSDNGDSSSACQLRQQQVLGSYTSSSNKVCQSLLGCWLSSLNGTSPDVTQLVEVQLALVQPKMASLSSSSSDGRRRVLQILPSFNAPITDDSSALGSPSPSPAASPAVPDGYTFESGSYSTDSNGSLSPSPVAANPATAATTPSPAATAPVPSIGMNGGIVGDDTLSSPSAGSPVENPGGIPAAVNSGTQSTSGSQGSPVFESGTTTGDWNMEGGSTSSGGSSSSSSSGSSSNSSSSGTNSSSSSSSSDSGAVQMTGGNAPQTFWKCAGLAAVKADSTRKWADIDYNSKSLTLTTWIKVIQPTVLIDWGVQVMECFKAEVSSLSAAGADDSTKPNKESMEYAIVALIRCFSAQGDAFRTYLQTPSSSQVTAGLDELRRLIQAVFPDQRQALIGKYNSTTAYDRDVMLQAAALVADMQWFMTDALSLASTAASTAQQQQVFEGVVIYGEEMIRRCMYWMFHVQFEGPPAYLPGVPPTTTASTAVMGAFDGLAAVSFPAAVVAADAPVWQQLQSMTAVAAGWAANAAAVMKATGKTIDAAARMGNTIDGFAKAHVHDFWGSRIELAREGASEPARALALADPSQSATLWQAVRERQVSLLTALQQQASAATDANAQQVERSLRSLISVSAGFLTRSSAADAAAQQQKLQDALSYAAYLAALVRQCHGSPVGLKPLSSSAAAAAGVPATAAPACTQLSAAVNQMTAAALGGTSDVVAQNLAANLNRQLVCNGQDTSHCLSTSGCKLALAGNLSPGAASTSRSSSSSGDSGSSGAAELLVGASSKSDMLVICQADDSGLRLSSWANSTKSQLAAGSQCQQFLQLQDCESISAASSCDNYAACTWEATSERNLLHTVDNATAGPATSSSGVCSYNWAFLLHTSGAYGSLSNMVSQCSSINDQPQCSAQVLMLTLSEASSGGPSNPVRYVVPALVAAVLLALVAFTAAIWYRRRTAAARRAAEERAGTAGGRGKKPKGGKNGKVNKQQLKNKVKRAEPGSYKPDLMRDSFTDYMREAPAVAAGVAVAKAAQEAGLQNAAAITLAQGDVAGARSYPHAVDDQQQYGPGSVDRYAASNAGGWPAMQAPSGNLIDIDLQSDAAAANRPPAPGALGAPQQSTQPSLPFVNSLAYPMHSQPLWGAAPTGTRANNRISGGLGSAAISGSGFFSGGLTEVDSLALTSSLGLVSSLPQPHGSLALGDPHATVQQQLGLLYPSQQGRRSSRGLAAMDPAYSANSGSLLLAGHASVEQQEQDDFRDVEEGANTPTSSCHDSVFSRATSGARMAPPVVAGSISSGSSWRGRVGPGVALNPALSGALSGALSRSSWSSAMSTDQLMSSQPSAQL